MTGATYCLHGNYLGRCLKCIDDERRYVGRLTIRYFELDQEYERLLTEKQRRLSYG